MPFSKNPKNYPPFFTKLLNSFKADADEIKFTLPTQRDCNRIRVQFYAFIRALERESEKLHKINDHATAGHYSELASLGRTRQAEIHPALDADGFLLSFVNRDANDTISLMSEQLSKQIPDAPALSRPAPPATLVEVLPAFAAAPDEEYHLDGLLLKDEE